MSFLYIALLSMPVLVAGSAVFFVKLSDNRLKVVLAFSAAYLLALSFLHLLPEIFSNNDGKQAGLWILAGFFMQVVLEFFSSGIEHGHAHVHTHDHKIPFALLGGLYLHSFIEGFPLSNIFVTGQEQNALPLLTGITLHNIPIAFAFAGLLLHMHVAKNKTLLCLLILALMAPTGAFVGYLLQDNFTTYGNLTHVFTALVVGIFLHIATTIIFETSEKNHRYHISKLLAILLGAALAYSIS